MSNKKSKPKKKSKKSKVRIAAIERRKALAEWSLKVRARDGFACIVCGSTEKLQAHHLLSKTQYKSIAFDLSNGVCVCAGCHQFRKRSFHQNGLWAAEFMKENRPKQWAFVLGHIYDD
jgi:5-methylcytosine-specific restriction endonuclease McrA